MAIVEIARNAAGGAGTTLSVTYSGSTISSGFLIVCFCYNANLPNSTTCDDDAGSNNTYTLDAGQVGTGSLSVGVLSADIVDAIDNGTVFTITFSGTLSRKLAIIYHVDDLETAPFLENGFSNVNVQNPSATLDAAPGVANSLTISCTGIISDGAVDWTPDGTDGDVLDSINRSLLTSFRYRTTNAAHNEGGSYTDTSTTAPTVICCYEQVAAGTEYTQNPTGTLTSAGALTKGPTQTKAGTLGLAGALTNVGPVLFEDLADDFDSFDTATWTVSGTAAHDTDKVKLPVLSSYAATLETDRNYKLNGSSIYGQFTLPAVGTGTREVSFEVQLDASNKLLFVHSGGTLFGRKTIAGANTTQDLSTSDTWWRIREASGTVYWDTSTDGESWTNRWSQSTPFAVTSLKLVVNAGYYGTESAADVYVDNINTTPGVHYEQDLSGTLTSAGTLTKTVSHFKAGTLATAGVLQKAVAHFKAGVLALAATLGNTVPGGTQFEQTLGGTITTAGAVQKTVNKFTAGTLGLAGELSNQQVGPPTEFTQSLTGTLTSSGTHTATVVSPPVAVAPFLHRDVRGGPFHRQMVHPMGRGRR